MNSTENYDSLPAEAIQMYLLMKIKNQKEVPTRPLHYLPIGPKLPTMDPHGSVNVKIEVHETNPEQDVKPTGVPKILVHEERAYVYNGRGHFISNLTLTKLIDLRRRFDQSIRRTSVQSKIKKIGTFEAEVLQLIQRYQPTKQTNHKDVLKNHWTTPTDIMQALH